MTSAGSNETGTGGGGGGVGDSQSMMADGQGLATASFKMADQEGTKTEFMRSRTAGMTSSGTMHSKVTYLQSEELEPLTKQCDKTFKEALHNLMTSSDWNI